VTGELIVGAEGKIFGDVSAQSVIIGGEVEGNVTAPERVELTSSARLFGDINTTTIVIDEKAVFQGGCNMNQEASSKRPRLARKVVKEGRKSAKAAIAEALKEVEAENKRESSETEAVKEETSEGAVGEGAANTL
jgi:cytoskeletal protein CcmA (bactofilin family)